MTTAEPSLSQARPEVAEPGRRRRPRTGAWLPTWDQPDSRVRLHRRRGAGRGRRDHGPVRRHVPSPGHHRPVAPGPVPSPHPGRAGHHRPARRPGVRDELPGHQLRGHPAAHDGRAVRPQRPGASRRRRTADLAAAAPAARCQRRIARPPQRIAHRAGGHHPPAQIAHIRAAIDKNIATFYNQYASSGISGSNPADNEMAKVGLWLVLDIGIGFLVGLGLGSLTGQRTTTIIVLIALEIIVTPLLARVQLPYFIDGERLLIGIPMDQFRPAALAPPPGSRGRRRPRASAGRRAGRPQHPPDADLGHDLGDRRLDRRLVRHRSVAHDDPRRLTVHAPRPA